MGVPQIVVLIFCFIVLLAAANQHGKQWRGRVNFWIALAAVCMNIIVLTIGGFFSNMINFRF